MLKKIIFIIAISFLFFSCELFFETEFTSNYLNFTFIDAPDDIAQRAFKFAQLYEQEDTVYEWGGQEPLRQAIGIDCSGLVVMCYKYAMVDTVYELLSSDMTAQNIYDYASRKVNYTTEDIYRKELSVICDQRYNLEHMKHMVELIKKGMELC